jgi:hypothetical protein
VQVQRANTLDGILNGDFDDLPELNAGYFSFPVDDFFDNYVDALGQQKGMQGVGATDPGTTTLSPLRPCGRRRT